MTPKQYHATHAVSSSMLKTMAGECPKSAFDRYVSDVRKPFAATEAMNIGTLIHHLAFFGRDEAFRDAFAEIPEGVDRRSKTGKEFFAEIESRGVIAVTAKMQEIATRTLIAMSQNKFWMGVKFNPTAQYEHPYFWDCARTGLHCKMLADVIIHPCAEHQNGAIIDLKTCRDATPSGFGRDAYQMGYDIQCAHYATGLMDEFGTDEYPEFIFLAAEKNDDPLVVAYRMPEPAIDAAMKKHESLMIQVAECYESGVWAGYADENGFGELVIPSWELPDDSGDVEIIFGE